MQLVKEMANANANANALNSPSLPAAPDDEESDLLARSKKRVRMRDEKGENEMEASATTEEGLTSKNRKGENEKGASYKSILMNDEEEGVAGLQEDVGDPNDTTFDNILDPDSGISIEGRDTLCPNIVVSAEEKERMYKPFRQTLLIKVIGRKVGFSILNRRLHQIWAHRGKLKVVDIDDEFFHVSFQDHVDYENALTGGPWTILDSYLYVRRWQPNFDPRTEHISKMAVWVRLPDLPGEYYDKKFLFNVGNIIGKTLKVDINTARRDRGRFARICVEVDLTKPLLPTYQIEGTEKKIQYESMSLLCLSCGIFGHSNESCASKKNSSENMATPANRRENEVTEGKGTNLERAENREPNREGLWSIVQRSRRGRKPRQINDTVETKSRYAILREEDPETSEFARESLTDITNTQGVFSSQAIPKNIGKRIINGKNQKMGQKKEKAQVRNGQGFKVNFNGGPSSSVFNNQVWTPVATKLDTVLDRKGSIKEHVEGTQSDHLEEAKDGQVLSIPNTNIMVTVKEKPPDETSNNHVADIMEDDTIAVAEAMSEGPLHLENTNPSSYETTTVHHGVAPTSSPMVI